jgi:hypothetical protein
MTITPAQCRAARGLLGWNQVDLGARANVHRRTVEAFEKCRTLLLNNVNAIRDAFEKEGVIFCSADGEFQDGVALKWGSEDRVRLREEAAKNAAEDGVKRAMHEFWSENKDVWETLPKEMKDVIEDRMGGLAPEETTENMGL